MKPGSPIAPQTPIEAVLRPFQRFMQKEASSGVLLLVCAVVAMVWANSGWAEWYEHLWSLKAGFSVGSFAINESLHFWVNDALMAIFFFVVGLEIKRELLVGELSSVRKASLPVAAAIGGMVVPAGVYAALNMGGPGLRGWGVPMATDIAFALGVVALLGSKVPVSLKIFLTAVAIVDDIGAVLVIAIFYSHGFSAQFLLFGLMVMALMGLANALGVRRPIVYFGLGVFLWYFVLKSGVHATIAGVLAAAMIPARSRIDGGQFVDSSRRLLSSFEQAGGNDDDVLVTEDQQGMIRGLESACEYVQTPLDRLTHMLHPWVAFFIMPLFALANAGVNLAGSDLAEFAGSPVFLGIVLGLVLGKQIGITLACWIGVKMGWGDLPSGASWTQVYGIACVAGIGFTMSLFIAELAFSRDLLDTAKIGILIASLVAAVIGWIAISRASTKA